MEPLMETSLLIECLDAFESGESVEQILNRYPDQANELRPLLETAVQLSQFQPQPSSLAQQRSKNAFLALAVAQAAPLQTKKFSFFRLQKLLIPLAVILFVFLFGVGLVNVSASSIPGEPLYGTKRFAENIQLVLSFDLENRTVLKDQFNQERINEIQMLLDKGREFEVKFRGVIENIEVDHWVVASLNIQIDSDTQIKGLPAEEKTAIISGRTQGGELTATRITVIAGELPVLPASPTKPPTLTATSLPTSTPKKEKAITLTPSPSLTNTSTSEPGEVLVPTLTATPTPEPTHTSVPLSGNDNDDNENGDEGPGDDNQNENEDGDPANENENDPTNDNDNENDNDNDNGRDNENDNDNENDDDNDRDNENDNDRSGSNKNENDG